MNDQLKFVFSNAEKITESEFKSNCKLSIKSNYQTMPDITVTCEGIAKLLNLNPNKAAGPDDFCNNHFWIWCFIFLNFCLVSRFPFFFIFL
jgi:hypothetical protein